MRAHCCTILISNNAINSKVQIGIQREKNLNEKHHKNNKEQLLTKLTDEYPRTQMNF